MLRTVRNTLLAPLVLAVLSALPLLAEGGAFLEKTVDAPRDAKVPVDITYAKATLVWVESQGEPKEKEIQEAERKGSQEHKFVLIRFTYSNEDYVSHKVKLRAVLLGEGDTVIGEGGRTGTLDPKQTSDTVSFPMKVKIVDWPKARKMKVTAAFLN